MNKRNGTIDLIKFIASMIVMIYHLCMVGLPYRTYPYTNAWTFVEIFLMITGYFTAKHFDGRRVENKCKVSVEYTLKKFIPFLPYTIFVTVLTYILEAALVAKSGAGIFETLKGFLGKFAFDILLISNSFERPLVTPLWFLSSMFLAFPVFAIIMMDRNRYRIMIISFLLPIMYYGYFGVNGYLSPLHDIIRVFVGMLLGALSYEITYAFGDYLAKANKLLLTCIELICFLIPMVACYRILGTYRLNVLCFFIMLTIAMSSLSYTYIESNKFTNYLGRISMPIFILQYLVGRIIRVTSDIYGFSLNSCMIAYFVITIAISCLAVSLFEKTKFYSAFRNCKLELKD